MHWLPKVSKLKMNNFDTHLVFICNAFNSKPIILTKPKNDEFSFSRLQIYFHSQLCALIIIRRIQLAIVPN